MDTVVLEPPVDGARRRKRMACVGVRVWTDANKSCFVSFHAWPESPDYNVRIGKECSVPVHEEAADVWRLSAQRGERGGEERKDA